MSDEFKFPRNFYWGAAASAHQVEGGNYNDWTEFEKRHAKRQADIAPKCRWPEFILKNYPNPLEEKNYISGKTCDHYNRFREDFDIAKSLGHNAHRFSIEWSRIEPEEGKFNEKEIEHYREVIRSLRERGMEPFVTLWHWTIPLWVRDKGGVASSEFPFYFARFSRRMAEEYRGEVRFWMTLNEPTSVIINSYLRGLWPPQKKSIVSAFQVSRALASAHRAAYRAMREAAPDAKIGFGNIMVYAQPYRTRHPLDRLFAWLYDFWSNRYFLMLTGTDTNDYLALQYYFHIRMKFPQTVVNENKRVSDMGWELYPEGLYHLLKRLGVYQKPIYVTENGLADARDSQRAWFIEESLRQVARALKEGVDVRGYFYWSLLDNFEWDKGFWPRFGLTEVNYKTFERKIRPSAWEYKKIIEAGITTTVDRP